MNDARQIIHNRAKCNACGDVISSRSRYNFQRCKCGETFVDGGTFYLRRGFGEKGFTEMSVFAVSPEERSRALFDIREAVMRPAAHAKDALWHLRESDPTDAAAIAALEADVRRWENALALVDEWRALAEGTKKL